MASPLSAPKSQPWPASFSTQAEKILENSRGTATLYPFVFAGENIVITTWVKISNKCSPLGEALIQTLQLRYCKRLFPCWHDRILGRGIEKMIAACQSAGLPLPELIYETAGLWVVFHYRELGERRVAIVNAMHDDPKITVKKLAEMLELSTTAIEKNLQYLKKNSYIERTDSAKGGYWKVTRTIK